jgi:hypothetical protein
MRNSSSIFNATKQQGISILQPHCARIEDTVDWVGPMGLRQDRVIRIAGK